MKKVGFLILMVLTIEGLHSQKLVRKAVVNPNISFFEIDTQNCYRVDIATSDTRELIVEAAMDGEYGKDLIVRVQEEGATARISAGFPPNFILPNDKLSAHKLISIDLRISLPAHNKVRVNGYSSDVSIRGSYTDLVVVLNDGRCTLERVGKKVSVHTLSGDIILKNATGSISARSTYGKVHRDPIPEGDALFTLDTVTGNIVLNSTN